MTHLNRRRINRYKGRPKVSLRFIPEVWIEKEHLYATCAFIKDVNRKFTAAQELAWIAYLGRYVRSEYNIDPDNMTLEYDAENHRYKVKFNNDAEFIMFKMMNT